MDISCAQISGHDICLFIEGIFNCNGLQTSPYVRRVVRVETKLHVCVHIMSVMHALRVLAGMHALVNNLKMIIDVLL